MADIIILSLKRCRKLFQKTFLKVSLFEPFGCYYEFEQKNNAEKFFENFFETYGKLHSLTVKIKMKKFKKLFETTHNLGGFSVMMTVEKEFLNFLF